VLLSRHYEAMHFADRYVQSPRTFGSETIANPDIELFHNSEIVLVKNPFSSRDDFLPAKHHPVHLHCMLLQSTVTRCTFQAEQEMSEVFRVKYATSGLTSDLLHGQNLHIVPPRIVRVSHPDVAVIASDMTIDVGGPIPVSFSDIEYSLVNDDVVTDVKWVDPRVLLLPARYRQNGS